MAQHGTLGSGLLYAVSAKCDIKLRQFTGNVHTLDDCSFYMSNPHTKKVGSFANYLQDNRGKAEICFDF